MGMTKDQIKQLILERVMEARIYGDPYRTSDEYELTPDEISALKNMDHKQRMNFALKKLKIARREKGQCISGGSKCAVPPNGADGRPGPYCTKHLESFRIARDKLAKKRGSCTCCPNPPVPGKKLCQKCTDELETLRLKALADGLCIRCKKVPMQPNEKGEPTLFCRDCMKIKVALNKRRKADVENWKEYGRDVVRAIKDRNRKPSNLSEIEINNPGTDWSEDDTRWKSLQRVNALYPDRKTWGPEEWSIYMDSLRYGPGPENKKTKYVSTKPKKVKYGPEPESKSALRRRLKAQQALHRLQNPEPRQQRAPAKPKSRWRNLRHVLKKMLRTEE